MQSFSAFTILALGLMAFTPKEITSVNSSFRKERGWTSLFDGKSLKGWHTYGKKTVNASWKVEDGAIFFNGSKKDKSEKGSGDLVSNKEYEN